MGSRFCPVNRRIRQTGQVFENLIVMLLRAKFLYFRNDPIPKASKTAEFVIDKNRENSSSTYEDLQTVEVSFTTMQELAPVFNERFGRYDNRISLDGKEYILYGDSKPIVAYNYPPNCTPPESPDIVAAMLTPQKVSGLPADVANTVFQNAPGVVSPTKITVAQQTAPLTPTNALTELQKEIALNLFDLNFIFPDSTPRSDKELKALQDKFFKIRNEEAERLIERVPLRILRLGYGQIKFHICMPGTELLAYGIPANKDEAGAVYYVTKPRLEDRQIYVTATEMENMMKGKNPDTLVHEYAHFLMDQLLFAFEGSSIFDLDHKGAKLNLTLKDYYKGCLEHKDGRAFITTYAHTGIMQPQEYFAECFAAFFDPLLRSRGFINLQKMDPEMFEELKKLYPDIPPFETLNSF